MKIENLGDKMNDMAQDHSLEQTKLEGKLAGDKDVARQLRGWFNGVESELLLSN